MSTETTIQDGWYDAKAKTWAWKQASTGTWQLEIWFELSIQGQPVGTLPGWFAVTDNTIEKRVEQFTALGYAPVTCDIGQEIGCDESGACYGGLDINAAQRAKAAGGAAPAARAPAQQRPAPQQQRPAVQPTRGPQTARPVAEEAPDFSGGDECPF